MASPCREPVERLSEARGWGAARAVPESARAGRWRLEAEQPRGAEMENPPAAFPVAARGMSAGEGPPTRHRAGADRPQAIPDIRTSRRSPVSGLSPLPAPPDALAAPPRAALLPISAGFRRRNPKILKLLKLFQWVTHYSAECSRRPARGTSNRRSLSVGFVLFPCKLWSFSSTGPRQSRGTTNPPGAPIPFRSAIAP